MMKKLILVTAIVVATIGLVFLDSDESIKAEAITSEKKKATKEIETVFSEKKHAAQKANSSPKPLEKTNLTPVKNSLKTFDEDWCFASKELNEVDQQHANVQVKDWEIYIGKAKSKGQYSEYAEEDFHPNNALISSYEETSLETLSELAFKGDKWAMVAFVQNDLADEQKKHDIAERLLIQGNSYYALEYLVFESLNSAKYSLAYGDDKDISSKQVNNALTYALWGVEHYNTGGLRPFLALLSREPFLTKMPLNEEFIANSPDINKRYKLLSNRIRKEREKLNLVYEEPPKAAKVKFAEELAIHSKLHRNEMKILETIEGVASFPVMNLPCKAEIEQVMLKKP